MRPLNEIPTSEELLRLVGAQNESAWTTFVETYGGALRMLARLRLGEGVPSDAADEVVQSVFVALARRMSDFRYESERGRFRGYLAKCVMNAAKDYRQKVKTERERRADYLADRACLDGGKSSFDDALLQKALETVRASGRVGDEAWSVYRAYVADGEAPGAVAERHGLNVNAVYQTKNRISKLIKDEYERIQSLRPWRT